MAIPTNLIPMTVAKELENIETATPTVPSISSIGGVPSNLITINTSTIANASQSIAGKIPTIDAPVIPEFSLLNTVIPDSMFMTGSLDQVRNRTLNAAQKYINGLPAPRQIPQLSLPSLPAIAPRRPSFGQIKDFIETKIDRIKLQRQQASMKALDEKLKQRENPFEYRQKVKNKNQALISNTVLGRYNNQ